MLYPVTINHSANKARGGVHPSIIGLEQRLDAWMPSQLAKHPRHIRAALARRHKKTKAAKNERAANIELREYTEKTQWLLPANAGESVLREWAKKRARDCQQAMSAVGDDAWAKHAIGRQISQRFGLTAPEPSGDILITGCIRRLICPRWWRRQARVVHGRAQEREARALGLVHKKAGLYCSSDCFIRWADRQNANAQTLADTSAVCLETGEAMNLAEVAASGMANPKNRRNELMTRISGLEACANQRNDAALFVTLTAPPELHAVNSRTLQPGIGASITPRQGQDWLCQQWRCIRSAIKRKGLVCYGLRVVEPHHDGTPHWHLLLFVSRNQRGPLSCILHHYAVAGDERKARQNHACKIVEIDPARGSASGYVAKYVAKAVDGMGIDGIKTLDAQGREIWINAKAEENAQRVRAWASQWGIRQFQFIGSPPVTVWRELRRLDSIRHGETAKALHEAADAGDWSRYVTLMGGPCAPRGSYPARARYMAASGTGRYGESRRKLFIECEGQPIITRPLTWVIEYKPASQPREVGCLSDAILMGSIAVPAGDTRLVQSNVRCQSVVPAARRLQAVVTRKGEITTGIEQGVRLSWTQAAELTKNARDNGLLNWVLPGNPATGPCFKVAEEPEPPCVFNRTYLDFLRDGAAVAPWTRGNNCTGQVDMRRNLQTNGYLIRPP